MERMSKIAMLRGCAAAFAACAAFVCFVAAAQQQLTTRDVLWVVVNDECVPHELQEHDPTPCVRVDLDDGVGKGFAVLKDIRGNTQFLLIPTARIAGIESPAILAPDAPNYFAEAWDARTDIDAALGRPLPREDIGLAINSVVGRSQDQLHIHVDCVRPDVQSALREESAAIGDYWAPLDVPLSGHRYWARWVAGESLGANNPFRLLAEGLPGAAQDMGGRTLVVIGSSRPNGTAGFVLLEDQVDRENHDVATGEELLDHSCSIATPAAPKN
jgi:CDP-diacylglycerol pyrophosphatase